MSPSHGLCGRERRGYIRRGGKDREDAAMTKDATQTVQGYRASADADCYEGQRIFTTIHPV